MQENDKGYPRPVMPRNGQNTPIPWVSGDGPERDEWAYIDTPRSIEAEVDEKCIVCGLDLPDNWVYMLVQGLYTSDTAGLSLLGEIPAPTKVHPKCGQIAANFCPHFKKYTYVAKTQNGQSLTKEELSDIARKSDKPSDRGQK